jgi:hypothetical protein
MDEAEAAAAGTPRANRAGGSAARAAAGLSILMGLGVAMGIANGAILVY